MCNHKFMTFGCDKNGSYRICSKCGEKIYIVTNADRIRGMSDEKLATLLSSAWNKCDYEDDDYDPAWLDWLRQPAETEGTE
jgi:hypothetical protein